MAFSKVILNGTTLMDVTSDTVASNNLLTGYTATGADGQQVVGSATGGNDFIVTFSWNSSLWACDKTYAEIEAAYNAGKNIVVTTNDLDAITAEGYWDDTNDYFVFVITWIDDVEGIAKWSGYIDSNGLHNGMLGDESIYIYPNFQTITKTYTPTTSQQTETVTYSSSYNGLQEVDITVNAMPSGTAGTPTASKGTVSNHSVSVTPSVTNTTGYITGGTKTGTAVSVSASELVSGTYSVTSSGTKDVTNYASASVPAGSVTAPSTISGSSATVSTGTNTLTLSKSVSNTPNVTTAGYISSGTAGDSSVSLTANVTTKAAATITPGTSNQTIASGTYLTGTQTISGDANLVAGNIKKDTSIFGVTGTYEGSGGGGGTIQVATATKTLSSASSSIQFTGLSGEPTSFVVTSSSDQTTGGTKVVGVVYDGTSLHGIDITTQAEADTGFTKSYSSGTLTITATTASFQANEYKIVYTYGGSTSDIGTEDVQVGSGATSITFTGLTEEPNYWSCIFKSSFSTSSGYQRVMIVAHDGSSTYGFALDSSAKAQTTWTSSYSNGSLTITSSGTNSGGYFHQPGYYQLTYATDPNAPSLQVKTGIGASTSSQTITADTGYDGLKSVQINAVSQTNLSAGNIKNGTTISISNGSTNLWSVTGTYSGGGSSKNVQIAQSTSRASSTTYTSLISLTCSKTGTYDVYWTGFRSSTSGTWGSQLYIAGSAYGTAQTTFTNNIQNVHLTNVSLTANQTVAVYARSRGSNYYAYVSNLVIIEQ